MKIIIKVFTLLLFWSCTQGQSALKNKAEESLEPKIEYYGYPLGSILYRMDSTKLSTFQDFDSLLDTVISNQCYGIESYVPVLKGRFEKRIVTVAYCVDEITCIRQRNLLEIYNDSVYNKLNGTFYPLDSLYSFLRRDLENCTDDFRYAQDPRKLSITISTDRLVVDRFMETLDQLTTVYSEIQGNNIVNIWLRERPFF